MKTLLFGSKDRSRKRLPFRVLSNGVNAHGGRGPLAPRNALGQLQEAEAYDTADSTALLTPEFDKGNDDVTAIRSSLDLEARKRSPHAE